MQLAVNLKPWVTDYAEQLAYLANNYNIAKFMRNRFPHPYGYADAKNFICWIQENYSNLVFAIECDGIIVGSIGLFPGDDIYCATAELGYWIGEEYWGRGIASAALLQMVDYVFANFSFNKIKAHVFHPNTASMRVLEKCGFCKEAVLKASVYKYDEYLDEHLYAVFRKNDMTY